MTEKKIVAVGLEYEGFLDHDLGEDYNIVVFSNEFMLKEELETGEFENPFLFLISCTLRNHELIPFMQKFAPVVMNSCGDEHEELKPTYTIPNNCKPGTRFVDQLKRVIEQIDSANTAAQ